MTTPKVTTTRRRFPPGSEQSPGHYAGDIDCIDAIRSATGSGFFEYCRGQVIKYVWRAGKKTSESGTDLRKAEFYLRMMQDDDPRKDTE